MTRDENARNPEQEQGQLTAETNGLHSSRKRRLSTANSASNQAPKRVAVGAEPPDKPVPLEQMISLAKGHLLPERYRSYQDGLLDDAHILCRTLSRNLRFHVIPHLTRTHYQFLLKYLKNDFEYLTSPTTDSAVSYFMLDKLAAETEPSAIPKHIETAICPVGWTEWDSRDYFEHARLNLCWSLRTALTFEYLPALTKTHYRFLLEYLENDINILTFGPGQVLSYFLVDISVFGAEPSAMPGPVQPPASIAQGEPSSDGNKDTQGNLQTLTSQLCQEIKIVLARNNTSDVSKMHYRFLLKYLENDIQNLESGSRAADSYSMLDISDRDVQASLLCYGVPEPLALIKAVKSESDSE
ncbi:hypothetical protein ANO11243_093230 [Dothideomycetidae sp. 11243]|nr:hypothetical protein ANO11243_093230 [fungal sp. No.11243]